MSQNLKATTYEYGSNATYIAEMYDRYLTNPNSVDESWQNYFRNFSDNYNSLTADFGNLPWGKPRSKIVGVAEPVDPKLAAKDGKDAAPAKAAPADQSALDSVRAQMMIRAYRRRGHLIADLDPLGLAERKYHPELDPAKYGFSDADMNKEVAVAGWLGFDKLTVAQTLQILRETYCSKLTIELAHIQDPEKREWLEKRMEGTRSRPTLSKEKKIHILKQLVDSVGFEEFLHKKFPGTKRFSAEGGEGLMPALDAAVAQAASMGLKEVVVGMPHRGRLNVLTAFMGKPYVAMLSEFQGNSANPAYINSSGDVKYHLGFSNDKDFGGNMVHLSLTPNPSHLEAVNPVVCGKVRAKQDQLKDTERTQAMGILLHGDAAFCGQGVVAESLSMSDLDAYTTGGTIHIVVNNQVGFTTTPAYGHKSPYPTDVAMMIQAPIFHINGEDPEAIYHAASIAAEYKQIFKRDVVLDIWCYRKHGHNEGDEPRWTQPKMYAVIDAKQTPREIYAAKLIAEGVITAAEVEKMKDDFYNMLDADFTKSNTYKPEKADMLEGKWSGIRQADPEEDVKIKTGVDEKILKDIAMKISEEPKDMKIHSGIQRVLKGRRAMAEAGEGFDWATGEALAFGSLLLEGKKVRLTGQDCIRGTFSQRHSGIWDQVTENIYFPLNNLDKKQALLEVTNSNLSEFAVMGYEYGYSTAEPNALTLWEGQFGDFVNGAQTIIDQFITSAEVKWLRMSGLVLLLPHGYEGQGPEHSSARLERFLQQCAEDNIIVANCTTPANYFHILRRQLCRDYRKPLVLMTPKSLLRHKLATSSLKDMGKNSSFKRVIPEIDAIDEKKARKVIICSGKVYYDLLEERRNRKITDVAIIRLEQFYPFPHESLAKELKKYPNAQVIWCQEEPENMGGWSFVDRRIEKVLVECKSKNSRPVYVGRGEGAATACGYMKTHKAQQEKLVNEALS
jgi:2-oxoglutarate dehydrogenase E1 component